MSLLKTSYDPACGDLARHFLGGLARDALVAQLAQHIQNEIEGWLEYEKAEIEKELARKGQ